MYHMLIGNSLEKQLPNTPCLSPLLFLSRCSMKCRVFFSDINELSLPLLYIRIAAPNPIQADLASQIV